jgi:hypothetical protein
MDTKLVNGFLRQPADDDINRAATCPRRLDGENGGIGQDDKKRRRPLIGFFFGSCHDESLGQFSKPMWRRDSGIGVTEGSIFIEASPHFCEPLQACVPFGFIDREANRMWIVLICDCGEVH